MFSKRELVGGAIGVVFVLWCSWLAVSLFRYEIRMVGDTSIVVRLDRWIGQVQFCGPGYAENSCTYYKFYTP